MFFEKKRIVNSAQSGKNLNNLSGFPNYLIQTHKKSLPYTERLLKYKYAHLLKEFFHTFEE
ncbi:hypothetical protein CHU_0072 [Cytophaga hutchinsonii ATCC 33406]|uniref:Uncharacterized protein n=1 Tax=Cytophaga hutchinsonii (strain ATCC 33406 / DSM 1761 / CIP 103989 / NBRC 15051 / NCIMB 9469 / D465) TaxID=269798 RepID=A0A6N4SM84_CYTH3|nr:hypothetical protein CHU_0072 [Cytophaga hutchinsonii ATCC 33406]